MRTIYHNNLLDRMCERFGDAPIDKLVAKHGCRRFYVPVNPSKHCRELLGDEVAEWLRVNFSGHGMEVPSKKTVMPKREIAARNLIIQTSTDSIASLAVKFQITRRQVQTIRNQRPDSRLT